MKISHVVLSLGSLFALAACSASPTGIVAASMIDGQVAFAVLGCDDGPKNAGFRLTSSGQGSGDPKVLAEWQAVDPLPRKSIFNPSATGDSWKTVTPLTGLEPSGRYTAYAYPNGEGTGRTDEVRFTLADVESLKPGEWLYSAYQSGGEKSKDIQSVNLVTDDLDELALSEEYNGCVG